MMERVAIVTDAVADLPSPEVLKTRYGVGPIIQIPLWVHIGQDSYQAGVNLDNKEFKKLLDETGIIPTTAASTPAVFFDVYNQLTESGLEVVSIHVGDNLSATGANAREAAKMLGSDKVTVYDDADHRGSGTVSMAEGLMAIGAKRAAADGASRKEILALIKDIKRRTSLRGVTPNIPFLKKSGRASTAEGIFGVLLNVKPILQIDNGVVKTVEKPRTMRRALDWLVNFVKESGIPEQVAIVDFEAEEAANLLMARLILEAGIPEARIYRGELGQLTGTHSGPGTFGLVVQRAG